MAARQAARAVEVAAQLEVMAGAQLEVMAAQPAAAEAEAALSAGSPLAGTARAVKSAGAALDNAQRYSRIAADKSLRNFEVRNRQDFEHQRHIERSVLVLNRLSAPIR